MAAKRRKNEPDEIEDFLARQDYTHDPGKFVGSYRYNSPLMILKRAPIALVLIGLAGALTVLIVLFVSDFTWSDLLYYVPALGVSALFIFGGIRRLKPKAKDKGEK